MKRAIALLLCCTLLLSGCGISEVAPDTSEMNNGKQEIVWDPTPEFSGLDDPELLSYVEEAVCEELLNNLDQEMYYVQEVSATYVSKEYLDELEYNSQANIFFGYNLKDLDTYFEGDRYVFTMGDSNETVVQKMVTLEDDTFETVVKNVAIGAGVIIICVVVAYVTKNPAAGAGAGKAVKMIFTASSMGAKAATTMAISSAAIGGTAATVTEAIRTNDVEMALKAGIVGASDGFKTGAIAGAMQGFTNGIIVGGNVKFFPDGTPQALKYPDGVEFTQGSTGQLYPRFEKWAKATAKFDPPTLDAALNHTGLSGIYYWDAKLANAQCGYAETPKGYVWHHVEDMQTMILVPQDLHSPSKGGMFHCGGASLIGEFLGLVKEK